MKEKEGKNKNKSVVYSITNKINGKKYIGSTLNKTVRFNKHKNKLNKNIHDNIKLQRAWNKYGNKNFDFDVLFEESNRLTAFDKEQELIKSIGICNLYNICESVYKSRLGVKTRKETKDKMKIIMSGKIPSKNTIDALKKKLTVVLSNDIIRKIIEIYNSGSSMNELSKKFGLSVKKIRKTLVENAIEIRTWQEPDQFGDKNPSYVFISNKKSNQIKKCF
jgi:group I intron endonuclease